MSVNGHPKAPKRQRRSYSCGQCKALKIKCDLQVPCLACLKFKRANKCLLDPPHPPSKQELDKIKQRKSRTIKRKQQQQNPDDPDLLADIPEDEDTDMVPQSRPSISHGYSPVGLSTGPYAFPGVPYDFHVSPGNTGPVSVPVMLPRDAISPSYGTGHGGDFAPPGRKLGTSVASSTDSIGSNQTPPAFGTGLGGPHSVASSGLPPLGANTPQNGHLRPPLPPVPALTSRVLTHPSDSPTFRSGNTPLTTDSHLFGGPVQFSLPGSFGTPFLPQPRLLVPQTSVYSPSARVDELQLYNVSLVGSIHATKIIQQQNDADRAEQVELAAADINAWRPYLPKNEDVAIELFNNYVLAQHVMYEDLLDIRGAYHAVQYLQHLIDARPRLLDPIFVDVVTVRAASCGLIALLGGLLYCDYLQTINGLRRRLVHHPGVPKKAHIAQMWLQALQTLKERVMRAAKLNDFVYIINWYLFAHSFYTALAWHVEHYMEYNRMLLSLLVLEEFMRLVADPEAEVQFSKTPLTPAQLMIHQLWFQVRLAEIGVPFFQMKGTLLLLEQYARLVLPARLSLLRVYGDDILDDRPLMGALPMEDMALFQISLWGLYYKRFMLVLLVPELVRLYLYLYLDVQNAGTPEVPVVSKRPMEPLRPLEIAVLVRNQVVVTLFVRWLSFVQIETRYFPSLRYALFLTTILNLFNMFHFLDEHLRHHGMPLYDVLMRDYPAQWMWFFYECLGYYAAFLLMLQPFAAQTLESALDLLAIFETAVHEFHRTVAVFLEAENYTKGPDLANYVGPVDDIMEHVTAAPDTLDLSFQSTKMRQVPVFRKTLKLCWEVIAAVRLGAGSQPVAPLSQLVEGFQLVLLRDLWLFLVDVRFGSIDNFLNYTSRLWECFLHVGRVPSTAPLRIHNGLNFDMDLVNSCNRSMTGLKMTREMVDRYIKEVVEAAKDD